MKEKPLCDYHKIPNDMCDCMVKAAVSVIVAKPLFTPIPKPYEPLPEEPGSMTVSLAEGVRAVFKVPLEPVPPYSTEELRKHVHTPPTYTMSAGTPLLAAKSTIRIDSRGSGADTHFYVDGHELKNITNITWSCDAHGLATAVITMAGVEVALEMKAPEVTIITEGTKAATAEPPMFTKPRFTKRKKKS